MEPENQEIEDRDHYYRVLGVSRNSSQHEITDAYERLAYAYHPDRDENSMDRYRSVSKAYHVLSDPNKRRQYDLDGIIYFDGEEYSGLDVKRLGGIGRVIGAMITRFGVPLPTQVSQEVLQTATAICSNDTDASANVEELVWGWSMDGSVGRQEAVFYRIDVDPEKADNGFIVFCRSLKGKFKLVVFDAEGSALHIEESLQSRDKSQWETALYFLSAFDTYHLGTPVPPSLREQDLPAVFGSLDSFTTSNLSIVPGKYLVCVYGDNFLGNTSYSLLAVPTLNDSQEAKDVQEMDSAVLQERASLAEFKIEYLKAKEAFENATRRLKTETSLVEDLLERREFAYSSFMIRSGNAFLPSAPSPPEKARPITKSASTATSTVAARQAVASASGWLSSRLTAGFGEINKYLVGEEPWESDDGKQSQRLNASGNNERSSALPESSSPSRADRRGSDSPLTASEDSEENAIVNFSDD